MPKRRPTGRDLSLRTPGAVTRLAEPDPAWWRSFRDPVLTGWWNAPSTDNLDLQRAVLRIAEARQNEAAARAAGLPALAGSTSYTRQQLGLQRTLGRRRGLGQDHGRRRVAGQRAGGALVQPLRPVPGELRRELGTGPVRPRSPTGRASAGPHPRPGRGHPRRAGDAGSRGGASLRRVARRPGAQPGAARDVEAARAVLELTQRRSRQGLTTELDVENQRAQLTSFEAQLPQYERRALQALNRLSVLVGQPPGTLDRELGPPRPSRRFRPPFRWACPLPWRGGGPTSAGPRRRCTRPPPASARRWRSSTPTSRSPARSARGGSRRHR